MRAVLAERLTGLSGRARRAVALMLVAAVSMAGISLYYLRPWTAIQASLIPKPVAVVPTPGIGHITNFSFVSTALGWSVVTTTNAITNSETGSYWVYKTVDAGKHWRRQLSGTTARLFLTFSSLWFADARSGYVVAGDPLLLYRTDDGGDHWTPSRLPVTQVEGLQFVDRDDGFAITTAPDEIFVYATHDAGRTWSQLPPQPTNGGFWPQFRSSDEGWSGWADERAAYAYLTRDGGASWSRSRLPTPEKLAGPVSTFIDVQPPGPLVFAYVSMGSSNEVLVYYSLDYGNSWAPVALPEANPNGVAMMGIDATHWWAIQDETTLYKTDDAGRSWVLIRQVPINTQLIRIIDPRHAWAVQQSDESSLLLLTSDGGVSWSSTNSPRPG